MLRNIIASVLVLVTLLFACRHEPVLINGAPPDVTPPLPGAATICFESNVLPIFVSNCAKSGCHDATTRAKEIQLDNYTDIMRGIKANNPGGSKYWEKLLIMIRKTECLPCLTNHCQTTKRILFTNGLCKAL